MVIIFCLYLIVGLVFAQVMENANFFSRTPPNPFEYYAIVFGYPAFCVLMLVIAVKLIVTKR